MQKSIEVEYWVIDRNGNLATPGRLTELSDQVEEEFVENLFEIKTPPCSSIPELGSVFIGLLEEVLAEARKRDKMLVPLGTPIHGGHIETLPGERNHIQSRIVGHKLGFARYCAGTHFHFEQRNVTDQLNTLLALDPALALVSSSPFFQGRRVAPDARAQLYRKWSYEQFPKHGQLWEYVETVAQWNRRLDRRFEEFKLAADRSGVDEQTFDDHFTPEDVVWTPVRLRHKFSTVEWRSPDAALPSQILKLVGAIEAIMEGLHDSTVCIEGTMGRISPTEIVLPEFSALCQYTDIAIGTGITSTRLQRYLDRMGFDLDEYHPITEEFTGRNYLSESEACDVRKQYARRLERDVMSLSRAIKP